MKISRASLTSLALAGAVHALVVVRVATTTSAPREVEKAAAPTELVFVELAPTAEVPKAIAPAPAPSAPTTTPASELARVAHLPSPAQPEPTPASAAPVPPLVGAAETNDGVFSPRAAGSTAGASTRAAPVRFGLPLGSFAEAAPEPARTGPVGPRVEQSAHEVPVDAAKILRAETDKRNVALGVGFGGPVAAAGRSALSAPSAPIGGRGRYEVRTNAAGQIVSVRALEGDAAWQAFGATLQAVLAGRTLRVPEGARGVVVVVALEARQQEVAGRASGVMNFDVANLAAGPSRVVSARVESERTL